MKASWIGAYPYRAGSDELRIAMEAQRYRERELRLTRVIHYDDGESVVLGEQHTLTAEELRFERDAGRL